MPVRLSLSVFVYPWSRKVWFAMYNITITKDVIVLLWSMCVLTMSFVYYMICDKCDERGGTELRNVTNTFHEKWIDAVCECAHNTCAR